MTNVTVCQLGKSISRPNLLTEIFDLIRTIERYREMFPQK